MTVAVAHIYQQPHGSWSLGTDLDDFVCHLDDGTTVHEAADRELGCRGWRRTGEWVLRTTHAGRTRWRAELTRTAHTLDPASVVGRRSDEEEYS